MVIGLKTETGKLRESSLSEGEVQVGETGWW